MNYIKKILEDLRNVQENQFCADCKVNETQYVSINNGIFLCYQCADIHANYGKQVSFVKNLEDPFDEYLIMFLIRGGNFKYKSFLFESGINSFDRNLNQVYFTKGMDYYRRNVLIFVYFKIRIY